MNDFGVGYRLAYKGVAFGFVILLIISNVFLYQMMSGQILNEWVRMTTVGAILMIFVSGMFMVVMRFHIWRIQRNKYKT